MLLVLASAHATTIAVLDLYGADVPSADLAAGAEAVRAALLAEGQLDPISGPDIADGVSHGEEENLREAREALDEARRLRADGDPLGARSRLFDARKRFVKARSQVGRRAELADAWFVDGLCALALDDASRAREDFVEALRLVPDYDTTRISRLPDEALPLLSDARDRVRRSASAAPTGTEVATIASLLSAEYLAVGTLSADGTVSVQVYDAGGDRVGRVEAHAAGVPIDTADPAWRVVAQGVANRVALAAPKASVTARTVEPEPEALVAEEPEPAEERSVVQRWWFWVGVAALLGGGAAGVAVALQPAPAPEDTSGPTYDVTVVLPD